MGVLDQVTEMKKQGMREEDIINDLQEQGIAPKVINDALNQSEIKNAVSDESNTEEYQPSVKKQNYSPGAQTIDTGDSYAPQNQEMYGREVYAPAPQEYTPQQEPYPQNYPQEGYENYGAYQSEAGYSDTIIEVSEQVFSEKIKKTQKQIEDLNEFKNLAETKIEYLEKSLRRIESIIDKLQVAILEKVGSYGKNLESIKKEMSMMQDSFGKMINSVADKTEKKHSISLSHIPHKTASKTKRTHKKG